MNQSAKEAAEAHASTRSAAQAIRPRSSTKGLLDPDQTPSRRASSPRLLGTSKSGAPVFRSGTPTPTMNRQPQLKDFSHLLRPETYHSLPLITAPPSFRNRSLPPTDTPIPNLVAGGHFRLAAAAAASLLTSSTLDPQLDHVPILHLLHQRLACLTLLPGGTALAAQEARILGDLSGGLYVDETTGRHLAPWALRVLHVRLQSLDGLGDAKRGIMAYYELGKEARVRLLEAERRERQRETADDPEQADGIKEEIEKEESDAATWRHRLKELGIRVAGTLVEMNDLAAAADLLASLSSRPDPKLAMMRALLWLHIGDVDAARRASDGIVFQDEQLQGAAQNQQVLAALCDMADGDYESALKKWEALLGRSTQDNAEKCGDQDDPDEMIVVNMAVCLLYVGKMQEGKRLLEHHIDRTESRASSHTLLFNLATMYELSTERSRDLKLRLAEKVAKGQLAVYGWERANEDFKL